MCKIGIGGSCKIVVVAGAGISKAAPSYLPSWWDYNRILIETLGEVASKAIGIDYNPIDAIEILNTLNDATISEFVVNRIAGDSYFPLISLLDGSRPNENHLMLARLAKENVISAIVTTNFDTLLEKAFDSFNIATETYIAYDDYSHAANDRFPIYKIHGSADNTEFAIDTVTQKLSGLSDEKVAALKELFSNNHVIFLGFSGQDFMFGSDYIPVGSCQKGITWVAHPGSTFNERTLEIIKRMNIETREEDLRSFYSECGWDVPEVPDCDVEELESFECKAVPAVRDFFLRIDPINCMGLCLELLDLTGDQSREDALIDALVSDSSVRSRVSSHIEYISVLTQIARRYRAKKDYEGSKRICLNQVEILDKFERFQERMSSVAAPSAEQIRRVAKNRTTVLDNLAISHLMLKEFDQALKRLTEAFDACIKAKYFENAAYTLYLIARVRETQLASHNELFF